MTEIVVKVEPTAPHTSPWIKDMAVGDVWEGRTDICCYSGVFLRTYEGLVLLNDPNKTWALSTSGDHVRVIGRKIKKLTIIAE